METTQTPAQEQSAQLIAPETTQTEQQPSKRLYNPSEAAQIVRCLLDEGFNPEYILLFGKLAGGAPHSDTAAYDLLIVVRQVPRYDWRQTGQLLRYKMPVRLRDIAYINPYIVTLREVESHRTPFLHFTLSEGELLYCRDSALFRRPRRPVDFAAAETHATHHFETFRALADDLLTSAHSALDGERNPRLAALSMAQAVVCCYRTLYYVYHGRTADSSDPLLLHERLRTLSARLMLTLDNSHTEPIFTLSNLRKFLDKALCDADLELNAEELATHLQRVLTLNQITAQCCQRRIETYRGLKEP